MRCACRSTRQARHHGPDAGGRARHCWSTPRSNAPKGSIDGEHRSFTVYTNDQLTKAAEYNNVILAYRNGAPVRVRTSATRSTAPENRLLAGWQNGKRGILLIIFKQPGANVIETVERIKAALPRLRGVDPAVDPCQHDHGPHADHPRLGGTTCSSP